MPTKNQSIKDLLNPENLNSVSGLKLLSKRLAMSQLQGTQKSLQNQASREFSQYKAYQPGDDTRLIDWKVYSRTDRYFIRENYTDRQINLHFLLDASASMQHSEINNQYTKIDFSRLILSTLAYIALEQGNDALMLTHFGEKGTKIEKTNLQNNANFHNLDAFIYHLLQIKAEGNWPQKPLISSKPKDSTLFVFISDFYESNEEMTKMIHSLSNKNNEVLVFLLLFENELSLNYPSNAIFKDLESQKEIKVNTKDFQEKYQEKIQAKIEKHKKQFQGRKIDFELMTNNLEIGAQLRLFLKKRQSLF